MVWTSGSRSDTEGGSKAYRTVQVSNLSPDFRSILRPLLCFCSFCCGLRIWFRGSMKISAVCCDFAWWRLKSKNKEKRGRLIPKGAIRFLSSISAIYFLFEMRVRLRVTWIIKWRREAFAGSVGIAGRWFGMCIGDWRWFLMLKIGVWWRWLKNWGWRNGREEESGRSLREVKIDLYRVMESEIRSLLGICYSSVKLCRLLFMSWICHWNGSCVCSLKLEVLAAPCRL